MIRSILQKLGWNKADETPKAVSIDVPEDVIREKMKNSLDFRMKVTESADISAFCKTCEKPMFIAQDEMLLWFHCKSCNRYSFDPPQNVGRNAAFAARGGRALEYEGCFIDFPPQLVPPTVFEAVVLRVTTA